MKKKILLIMLVCVGLAFVSCKKKVWDPEDGSKPMPTSVSNVNVI